MESINRNVRLVGRVTLIVVLLLAGVSAFNSCGSNACTSCRPGTYAKDPSESCSECVPCPDGGGQSDASNVSIWCSR
jgi:hypothetical protein